MALTAEQLQQYRDEGYTKGSPIVTGDALTELREQTDQLIANLPDGQRPENMPSIHYHNDYFRQLLLSDAFVDVAEQILGPDVALFTVYAISKQPKDGLAVDWHQDMVFFPIEPKETFTLWLAVDRSDVGNGCLRVLPGTHNPRRLIEHGFDNESGSTLPLSIAGIDTANAVDVELEAGAFSVHDGYILHGSNANTSDRRRCGFTIKYIPSYVKINQDFDAPSKFDWKNVRIFHARGKRGDLPYAN